MANGGRALFLRDIANVTMDMDDVERISFNALGGADSLVVGDMSGIDVNRVTVNLGSDGASDSLASLVDVLQRWSTDILSTGSTNCCPGLGKRQILSRADVMCSPRTDTAGTPQASRDFVNAHGWTSISASTVRLCRVTPSGWRRGAMYRPGAFRELARDAHGLRQFARRRRRDPYTYRKRRLHSRPVACFKKANSDPAQVERAARTKSARADTVSVGNLIRSYPKAGYAFSTR